MESSEHQVKRIVLDRMDRCSVCHRHYREDDVRVISRKPDLWMMVVQCDDCHARNFVAAVMNDGDPAAARMALDELTDNALNDGLVIQDDRQTRQSATPIEPVPPMNAEPVSAGDVIDMHTFLDEFDGDFYRLFGRSA